MMDLQNKKEEKLGNCPICKEAATKMCTGCREISYCSIEHQKKHWKEHKSICCPYIEKFNDDFARYLIASRDIKAREVIIREPPIVFGPEFLDFDEKNEKKEKIPACLGCSIQMNHCPDNRCKICDWPFCEDCEKENRVQHLANECILFKESQSKFNIGEDYKNLGKSIMIIRLLLLEKKNPKLWVDINLMEDHPEIRMKRQSSIEMDKNIIKNIKTLLPEKIQYEDNLIKKLSGIITCNAFEIIKNFKKIGKNGEEFECLSKTLLLFRKTTILAHSCYPNAKWGTSPFPNTKMTVRAATNIKKGDLIAISYGIDQLFFGTLKRRILIEHEGLFICMCQRCKDPSEMNSFLSGINCEMCFNKNTDSGYYLPIDPLKQNSDWKCRNCDNLITSQEIVYILNEINNKLEVIKLIEDMNEKLLAIDEFINKHVNLQLHRNHYIFQDASKIVFKIFEIKPPNLLTEEEQNTFIWHCENLLNVANIITPGFCYSRALLQYHLSAYLFRKISKVLPGLNDLDKLNESIEQLRRIYNLQEEALYFFMDNSENSHEDNCSYVEDLKGLKKKCKDCIDTLNSAAKQFLEFTNSSLLSQLT